MKVQDIVEARKNPELNPKVANFYQLRSLIEKHGVDNLYVRLSGIPKFGANPTAEYETTPLGIYAYPASYAFDQELDLPYPAVGSPSARYVIIFKLSAGAVVWNLGENDDNMISRVQKAIIKLLPSGERDKFNELSEGGEDPEARAISTIKEWFLSGNDDGAISNNQRIFDEYLDNDLDTAFHGWWIEEKADKEWHKKRKEKITDYIEVDVDYEGYSEEEIAAMIKDAIADPNSTYSIDAYENFIDTEWEHIHDSSWLHEDLENEWLRGLGIYKMSDVTEQYDEGLAWPGSMDYDIRTSKGLWEWIKDAYNAIHRDTPIRFRKILLAAGIDAVVDPGLSIIHENEPDQAVFLTINKVKQVGLLDQNPSAGAVIRTGEDRKPMRDTTRTQWVTAVKRGTYALNQVPMELRDYKMCLAAIKSGRLYLDDIPVDNFSPAEYADLINKLVTTSPHQMQYVKRGTIPEADYIALWKKSMIEKPMLWRIMPDDVKDILMPGWNAPTEVDRVKELTERLLK